MTAPEPTILDRLKAREAQRNADVAKRQEELQNDEVATESASAFLDHFRQQRAALEIDIQTYATTSEMNELNDLASRTAELEQLLASAAYFLPPFDLRNASHSVAALKEQLDAATQAKQPRKKFTFSKRPPPPPAAAVPQVINTVGKTTTTTTTTTKNAPSSSTTPPPGHSGRTLSGLKDTHLTLTTTDISASEDVTLSDLENCIIQLHCPTSALFVHRLRGCTILAGPVAGALHIEDVKDCALYAAARQVRIHAAYDCTFYLRVRAGPIIEHSSGLGFAPYPALLYPQVVQHLQAQGLGEDDGQWADVQDFGWLRTAASPNWKVICDNERQPPPLL